MTPGQARFALTSFLLVTVGVAFNAVFLQAKPVVAARAAERTGLDRARVTIHATTGATEQPASVAASAGQQPLRIARYAPDTSKLDPAPVAAAGAEQEAGLETIRAIQRELRLRGYGPLAGDGSLGLPTRAAIMAFEHDQGLAPSGVASERLLRRILFGVAVGEGGGKEKSPHVEHVVRTVQQWLAGLGYQPGRVNGVLGEATVQAIRDFEVDKGLVPRGRIGADLVTRLSEAAAPKAPGR